MSREEDAGIVRGWNKTLKQLRKTGTNVLEKSNDHAELYEMFLDHSAVAKRHYLTSGEPVPRFDDAVKFFGEQMGFQTTVVRPASFGSDSAEELRKWAALLY